MNYKGYVAEINFDERDNIFWGKVLGLKDSVTFEGETVAGLVRDFHNAVDHYLADCEQTGRKPDKSYSGKLMPGVGSHTSSATTAEPEDRSLSQADGKRLVICTDNRGNEPFLEQWKVYRSLPDEEAEKDGKIRVIHEEGEDCLYPSDRFSPVFLESSVAKMFIMQNPAGNE